MVFGGATGFGLVSFDLGFGGRGHQAEQGGKRACLRRSAIVDALCFPHVLPDMVTKMCEREYEKDHSIAVHVSLREAGSGVAVRL
ncbi:hypothetical protein BQ8482_180378 [Mesorhizobium delmotii]|uniref:Uncharacterized protein n=1 Tax=Mesorhizobium delmotii TaxID=1631247 RepID=A0A2P9AJ51_9HYPH|nr:hypothetical protein BQ8482_180378 [Mesorhizobium delmotii]